MLKESKVNGSLNHDGVPDIIFMIDCMNKEHRVTPELDKRVFSISGGALDRLNPSR